MVSYRRFPTTEVAVGDIRIGAEHPIVLQSMTTSDTMDTEAVVRECIHIYEAGGELVRLTTPSVKEARHLAVIATRLKELGYRIPLVADVHFTPNAAEIAAGIVEKVRINPGNYAEKKHKVQKEYTEASYQQALSEIEEKLLPFIQVCKEHQTAVRIGTNHGSLSDRIVNRFGDTPRGMVESAMEFIRIFAKHDFHNLIISMKASNPLIMIQAYRLLVATMIEEGYAYPLHLGVTEAGDGEDGRVKSAIGIGTLLEDGIGDTIRVSLTEAAHKEIPVAKKIADRYSQKKVSPYSNYELYYNPYEYSRRKSVLIHNIGADKVPVIIHDLSSLESLKRSHLFSIGYQYSVPLDKWEISDQACDYIYTGEKTIDFELPGTLQVIQDFNTWLSKGKHPTHLPLLDIKTYLSDKEKELDSTNFFVSIKHDEIKYLQQINSFESQNRLVFLFEPHPEFPVYSSRLFFSELTNYKLENPVVLSSINQQTEYETYRIHTSIDFGALLIDGFGDGLWINNIATPLRERNANAFSILQATRTRISQTEYISCPSCGRTLFDLQKTTAKIKQATQHLKGIKIGIMGCIVNGPGEMADADYGYVGSGPGKINLYKAKEIVKRNVPSQNAVEELIALIKENGDWREPR